MYARGICVVAAWLVLLAIVPYGEISGDIVPGDDSMWARKACADESGLQVIDKMEHIGEVYAIVALEGGLVYAVTSYASKDANDVIWYPVHIRVFDVSIPMDICQVSRQEIKRLGEDPIDRGENVGRSMYPVARAWADMEGDLLYVGIMSTSAKGVRGQFVYYAGGAIFRLTTYYPSSYVVATPRDHCRTIGDYQVGATWRDIVISGDLAYVVGDRLLVLDISTRSDPTVVAEFPLERPGIHAGVSGGYAYIAYDDGVYALDVTDPANPVPAGDCKAGTGNRCLVADGDHVYLGGSSGLYVLQLSPEAVADVQQEAEIVPMDVAWDGQRLVLVEEFTASW